MVFIQLGVAYTTGISTTNLMYNEILTVFKVLLFATKPRVNTYWRNLNLAVMP